METVRVNHENARMPDEVLNPPVILVAEDNADDRLLLQHAIRSEHLPNRVIMVKDGAEAIARLQELSIQAVGGKCAVNLLVLDIHMPNKGGLEVLEWIQGRAECEGMTVVVMSGTRFPEIVDRALALGAHSYFFKPGDYGELIEFIKRFNQLPAFNYLGESIGANG
jgi:CheY-like chemotaxis protein